MTVVYIFLSFVFLVAFVTIKWQLEDDVPKYTEEEAKNLYVSLLREIELIESERNQKLMNTYEYAIAIDKGSKQIDRLEEWCRERNR